MMGSRGEIVEEGKIYVCVDKDVKESTLKLAYALRSSGVRKIFILHVHQPAEKIPIGLGTKFHRSQLEDHQVRAFHETERQNMNQLLDKYILTCKQAGVPAEKLHIEMDSIEKGIVKLIAEHDIRMLVMGAAADRHYSKKMKHLKSKKAIFVRLQAPASCHIWFICKGNLIYTREGGLNGVNVEVVSPSLQGSANTGTGQSSSLRSRSIVEEPNNKLMFTDYRRVSSYTQGIKWSAFSPPEGTEGVTPRNWLNTDFSALPHSEDDLCWFSPPSVLEGSITDEFYDQLEQAMPEAENSWREAFEESNRLMQAEKHAIEAIHRAKASESSYAEELRLGKELEEALARGKEEFDEMKQQLNEVMERLSVALEQKSSLVNKIANYQQERDELWEKLIESSSSTHVSQFISDFSLSEIEEATCNFDSAFKIAEGGSGSIYRGVIRHTLVAIKRLKPHSSQGPSVYQQEVTILSNLRHPNVITLIGACPEAHILIYEYLPNGSLEDRLSCKDNTPPLSWKTRIRIAAELCSVLIFLHSCRPYSVIHGDLKPDNILLDANYVTKLGDFGICHVLHHDEFASRRTTICRRTTPMGTFPYIDPEFYTSGELRQSSDVYSFGIILLRLLTGRSPFGIAEVVQTALGTENFENMLDPTAGDWPFVQAEQLAHIALSCCKLSRRNRPNLASEVWKVLKRMTVS